MQKQHFYLERNFMTLNLSKEKEILDALLNFEVPIIPSKTRFWMIRTQNGFFYEEFLAKRFVALATCRFKSYRIPIRTFSLAFKLICKMLKDKDL